MSSYSLNIKTEGHLILPKMVWFLSYLRLKCGLKHFVVGDVYLDRVVYPYCKGTWLSCTHKISNLMVMQCECT